MLSVGWMRLVETEMSEAVIIRDRAASDVDGQMRDLTIHLNPGNAEALTLLKRSVEHSIRGLVRESDGFVVIWDAYLTDHQRAEQLLKSHGHGEWWPRFSIDVSEFASGVVRNYIERDEDQVSDSGMSESDWKKIPTSHLTRMLGKPPRFVPT
jgi:hypothetical protein